MSGRIDNQNELEMIAAILAGDTNLYHELIRPYERRVYIMALSCMKNTEEGEELAQETFVRALHDLSTFRSDSKFGTWLISLVLDESRNRLRRQETFRTVSFDDIQGEEMHVTPAQISTWRTLPSEVVEDQEIRKLLDQAVNILPDIHKQVFLLCDVAEINETDTATLLDVSPSLVKVRLHRVRMLLQRMLAPQLTRYHDCLKD